MKKEHFEIILEDIDSKFNLVLEGYAALNKKIDDRDTKLTDRIDHNAFLLDALNRKVDAIDARLSAQIDGLESKVDGLAYKVDGLESKIDAVAADLSAHRADTEAHHGIYRVKETSEEFGGDAGDKG